MKKEVEVQPMPEEVKINPQKIASEKEEVKMKNPVVIKLNEGGGAFHEKKAKNKKENWGGPSKRKPPKKLELIELNKRQKPKLEKEII